MSTTKLSHPFFASIDMIHPIYIRGEHAHFAKNNSWSVIQAANIYKSFPSESGFHRIGAINSFFARISKLPQQTSNRDRSEFGILISLVLSTNMAPLNLGVLMVPYQTLDVAGPLDILSACSKAMIGPLEAAGFPGVAGLTEKSIDIEFHHINETMEPVALTAGIKALPSTTCDDCPPLDYLLIGGPDPFTYRLSDRFADFLPTHVKAGKGIFATCTGPLAISPSGILDGKNATTNHGAL